MRIITIDEGNSKTKVGIFENQKLNQVVLYEDYLNQQSDSDIVLLSSVKQNTQIKSDFFLNNHKKNGLFFQMPFDYANTIGIDRLIAAFPFYHPDKKSNTLIIDAGTFLTIDLVNHFGFNGGWIFPGITTFLKSYHRGEMLPTLEFETKSMDIPHSTNDAILMASNIYLESVLKATIKKASPSKIIITGGGQEHIYKILKNLNLEIELQSELYLLHDSMYSIHQNFLK